MGKRTVTQTSKVKWGITGSTLKLIAIIAMLIDHIGAIVLERMRYAGVPLLEEMGLALDYGIVNEVYMIMRYIGRLGFPIFCFLLIEGFRYTKDIKKYAFRLFLFALASELPFDLGFAGRPVYWQYQNVFFTLFLGLLVIIGLDMAEKKKEWNVVIRAALAIVIVIAGMVAADWLKTDYSGMGVLTITVMYACRKIRVLSAGLGCAVLTYMNTIEVTAFFILIPIHLYNGKRGWNVKWLFYVFYPAHILVLYLIACWMGLGEVMLR